MGTVTFQVTSAVAPGAMRSNRVGVVARAVQPSGVVSSTAASRRAVEPPLAYVALTAVATACHALSLDGRHDLCQVVPGDGPRSTGASSGPSQRYRSQRVGSGPGGASSAAVGHCRASRAAGLPLRAAGAGRVWSGPSADRIA